MTVVDAAIEERQRLLAARRKHRNSFDVFRVWAVFDRDEHPQFEEAIQRARENKIDVAYSNPCFELWPLLHLQDYGSQDGRHQVQRTLHEMMPNYHHERNPVVDINQICDHVGLACRRAETLLTSRKEEGNDLGCPSTTMGVLIQKIIDNGRTHFHKDGVSRRDHLSRASGGEPA